jgi:hypothetical protein
MIFDLRLTRSLQEQALACRVIDFLQKWSGLSGLGPLHDANTQGVALGYHSTGFQPSLRRGPVAGFIKLRLRRSLVKTQKSSLRNGYSISLTAL